MAARDVLIVGGGVIGCAVALALAEEKARVTVVERGEPGHEASWAAAGMLAPTSEHHEEAALEELAQASAALYPVWLERLGAGAAERVGYRTEGTLEVAFSEEEARSLDNLAGERLAGAEARRREPALAESVVAAVYLRDDVQLDNRRLLVALEEACRRAGIEIRSGVAVRGVRMEAGRAGGVVTTAGEQIAAGAVVNAAGCWAGRLGPAAIARLTPTRPVRGQMVALESGSNPRHILRSERAYLLPRAGGRLVVGSTMDEAGFDKSVTPEGLRGLLSGARALIKPDGLRFAEAWAGLRPDTPDHLPILGTTDVENYFAATGHFRNGILLAPITASLMAEVIVGRKPSLSLEPFSPLRFAKQSPGGGQHPREGGSA